jgi:hypothetical protein
MSRIVPGRAQWCQKPAVAFLRLVRYLDREFAGFKLTHHPAAIASLDANVTIW